MIRNPPLACPSESVSERNIALFCKRAFGKDTRSPGDAGQTGQGKLAEQPFACRPGGVDRGEVAAEAQSSESLGEVPTQQVSLGTPGPGHMWFCSEPRRRTRGPRLGFSSGHGSLSQPVASTQGLGRTCAGVSAAAVHQVS